MPFIIPQAEYISPQYFTHHSHRQQKANIPSVWDSYICPMGKL